MTDPGTASAVFLMKTIDPSQSMLLIRPVIICVSGHPGILGNGVSHLRIVDLVQPGLPGRHTARQTTTSFEATANEAPENSKGRHLV